MANAALVKKTMTHPAYFLALGLGSGLAPWAPGTFGSLLGLGLFLLLPDMAWWLHLLLVGLSFGFGVWICDWVARDMAVKDPGAIVWDEFVGMWLALFLIPEGWYWLVVAFLLFRLFDVWKPWPVSWLDRELEGGLGIMADDIAAGVYSCVVLHLLAFGVGAL